MVGNGDGGCDLLFRSSYSEYMREQIKYQRDNELISYEECMRLRRFYRGKRAAVGPPGAGLPRGAAARIAYMAPWLSAEQRLQAEAELGYREHLRCRPPVRAIRRPYGAGLVVDTQCGCTPLTTHAPTVQSTS